MFLHPQERNFADMKAAGRMGDQNIPGHAVIFRCRVNASLLESKWPGLMSSENGHSCTLQRLQSVTLPPPSGRNFKNVKKAGRMGDHNIVPGHVATFRCRNSASLLESKWLGLMLCEGEFKAMCRSNIALCC